MQTKQANTADGTSIRYVLWGKENAANRIALVHSLAMTAEFWTGVAEALGEDWQILAVDCRGHGESGKAAGPYTVDLFADDLADILDAENWERAIVGGASMGGCVALAFAARHPARVAGLALIDTTAYYGENAMEAWEGRANKALQEGMGALVDFQKSRWFSDSFREANPNAVQLAINVFLANEVQAYAETCRMLGRCDLREKLPEFSFPVEIIVGEEDYATPVEMADAMHRAIAGAKLTVLPKVRHFTPLEVPELIAKHIRRLAP